MNNLLSFVLVVVFVCSVSAFKTPEGWSFAGKSDDSEVLKVQLALTQRNLDQLDEIFWAVSDPKNDRYGQHLTADEILSLVSPPKEVETSVIDYLKEQGAVKIEGKRDMVKFEATIPVIESIFSCPVYHYQHEESGRSHHTCPEGYVRPSFLDDKIDLVTGISGFPIIKKVKSQKATPKTEDFDSTTYVVPLTLYNLYNYTNTAVDGQTSTLQLVEFMDYGSYTSGGLDYFNAQTSAPDNTIPSDHIQGNYQPSSGALESNLDVQFGLAAAPNVNGYYWTSPAWQYTFASNLLTHSNPPLISSISWGWSETAQCEITSCNSGESQDSQSQSYVERTNTEFQKLGAMGLTIVACSQDEGAPGSTNPSCSNRDSPINPVYPAASPYVLSVGATMLAGQTLTTPVEADIEDPPICNDYNCAKSGTEIVCTYPEALITSGGGFAVYESRPSYQDKAVTAYLSSSVSFPPSRYWNRAGRGIPDISALGHNYLISPGGSGFERVDGTSASTPVIAGILAVANSQRLSRGLSKIGFVNPLLYQLFDEDKSHFNDVTNGNNKCTEQCCTQSDGFYAAPGWDAATGLGTPNVGKLLESMLKAAQK